MKMCRGETIDCAIVWAMKGGSAVPNQREWFAPNIIGSCTKSLQ